MPASEREAGRLWGSRGTAGQTRDDADILAEHDRTRKQASDAPSVISAWARWRSAFRVAMSAIKGPQ